MWDEEVGLCVYRAEEKRIHPQGKRK